MVLSYENDLTIEGKIVWKTKSKFFENKQVRTAWNADQEEWYFSVVDVVEILTDSPNPQTYWRVLKKRLKDEGNETVTNCNRLKLRSPKDGKTYNTDVFDAKGVLRFVQSITSPKNRTVQNMACASG